MSRNIDKANTVLFRFQEQQAEARGYIDYNSTQRPRSVQTVKDVTQATQWRKQVIQEISQKMLKINDEKLSEYQIRDLNDELNKLMREKTAWEHRIKELGGPNYSKSDKIGANGAVIRGYTYFGRAKELSGVKELLQKQEEDKDEVRRKKEQNKSLQQRALELEQRCDLAYFGYLDQELESRDIRRSVLDEAEAILGDLKMDDEFDVQTPRKLTDELLKFERKASKKRAKLLEQTTPTITEINPPTLEEVEKFLVERRKRQLAEEFGI